LIIKTLAVGPILTNCYIVGDERSKEGAVIDPGGDAQKILDEVQRLGLAIRYVINTHGHFDHTLANAEVMAALKESQETPPRGGLVRRSRGPQPSSRRRIERGGHSHCGEDRSGGVAYTGPLAGLGVARLSGGGCGLRWGRAV